MRLKALAEIYTMISFAQLCNLIFFVKICQNFAKLATCLKIFANFHLFLGNFKILAFFLKKFDFRAVQRSELCRSRRELSNAYLLAKFGFDTAEKEPCKVCPIERSQQGLSLPREVGERAADIEPQGALGRPHAARRCSLKERTLGRPSAFG